MKPWRNIRRVAVAAFVCVHLLVLLAYNIAQATPGEGGSWLPGAARSYIHALGIHQRWNMFAPQVGASAGAPVLMIGLADGTFVYRHADTTPVLISPVANQMQIHKLPPQARACHWNYHVVDGRMRKFESYTTRAGAQHVPIRTTWTRWMLQQWLAENPGLAKDVVFVQFARAEIVYDGEGPLPRMDAMTPMLIEPRMDPHWPLPHARTFPGVLP